MFQLITVALFALAGLSSVSNAAPTTNSLMTPATPANAGFENMNVVPINWKRDHQVDHPSVDATALAEEFIKTAIAQVMSHQSNMAKRADEPLDLSDVFRGVFDKLIDYIIEITPLNDIVHGNYDFLYNIFVDKVDEIVSGLTGGMEPGIFPLAAPKTTANPVTAASGSTTTKKSTHDEDDDEDDEDNDDEYEGTKDEDDE